jgi:hypothetical protein
MTVIEKAHGVEAARQSTRLLTGTLRVRLPPAPLRRKERGARIEELRARSDVEVLA